MNSANDTNHDEMIPLDFHLSQNYPDPFKDKTKIKYCIGYKTRVRITLFNSEGKMIEKLLDEENEAGTYEIEFDANKDSCGEFRPLSEGTYIYHFEAANFCSIKKMQYRNPKEYLIDG